MNDHTNKPKMGRHRAIAVTALVAIMVWTVAGFIDRSNRGRFDPLFQPNYKVLYAPEGGTLESAGFLPGDSIISVEGIPVADLGMYSRWPRSFSRRPGETLSLIAMRGGQEIAGDIVLREPSGGNTSLILGGIAIVLAFVGGGLWALFTTCSAHGVRLAYIGLMLAAAVPGPYLGTWDGVATHFQVAVLVLWTILLLRFFLIFPRSKRIAQNRVVTAITYGPWLLLLCTLVLELLFHPRFYHTFGPLYGLLMFAYSGLAVVALVHTLVKTPSDEQRASGIRLILAGVVVALVPTLIGVVDWFFLWGIDIPGSNWFPLMLGAIPISTAMAVRRDAANGVRGA